MRLYDNVVLGACQRLQAEQSTHHGGMEVQTVTGEETLLCGNQAAWLGVLCDRAGLFARARVDPPMQKKAHRSCRRCGKGTLPTVMG